MNAELRLPDLLQPDCILIHPEDEQRPAVVKALLRLLADAGRIGQNQAGPMLRLVNEREELGTTALGGGLAVPHARANIEAPIMAFALLRDGRDGWKPLDDAPVHGVFLFLTPKSDDRCHQTIMKAVTSFARVSTQMRALRGCRSPEEIIQLFTDYA